MIKIKVPQSNQHFVCIFIIDDSVNGTVNQSSLSLSLLASDYLQEMIYAMRKLTSFINMETGMLFSSSPYQCQCIIFITALNGARLPMIQIVDHYSHYKPLISGPNILNKAC